MQVFCIREKSVLLSLYANHLLIDVGNTSKYGMESAPPLKAVLKWADSVTFTGKPVNSNRKIYVALCAVTRWFYEVKL